jgi:hypothetical protein
MTAAIMPVAMAGIRKSERLLGSLSGNPYSVADGENFSLIISYLNLSFQPKAGTPCAEEGGDRHAALSSTGRPVRP